MNRVIILLFAVALVPGIRHEAVRADERAPCFEITPNPALQDDEISVHLMHLNPGQRVTVRAQMVQKVQDANALMKSRTEFVADEQGKVDVGAVPTDAKDKKLAPMRVLWAMKPDPEAKDVASPREGPLDPYTVSFTAESDGKEIATATLELLLVSPDVVRTEVREKGLVGTFFRPAGKGRLPGIVRIGGSEGGLSEPGAALLASRGYAALALAYFRSEGLPKDLVEIPLEYFETALDWMQAQESVQGDRLAVMGASRGGELALLLGATFPKIKAIVAWVPSHVVWPGFTADSSGSTAASGFMADPMDSSPPAWTFNGKPVPNMAGLPDPELARLVYRVADQAALTPGFALALASTHAVRQAAIPVERIQGPVLLISGEDDMMWPSAYMARQVMKRLAEHKHPYPDEHFAYQDCGHRMSPHNMPVPPSRRLHPLTKIEMERGGTPEGSVFAGWDARSRVLEFLEKNLKRPE